MSWPENVGILALELIFPSQYVDQSELEVYDGVSQGKYTVGLGQEKMGFCSDREDINSLCLTVVKSLMEKNGVKPEEIGRLEVGTETIIDKSKSVKTVLMQLFEPFGVSDVEGIDTTNACYGGTAALFNAISWVESSAWNGRFALVVAADIAVYAKGSARPTGGAGAVAMLIGPEAPLVFDRGVRATFVKHVYDFYKPDLTSEYPTVDGKLSIQCYLNALDECYKLYCKNTLKKTGKGVSLDYFNALLFHSPYCKLVQKSLARLAFNDFLNSKDTPESLKKYKEIKLEESYFNRELEQTFLQLNKEKFEQKTSPSLLVASQVGNMYTPSLYGGLISLLVSKTAKELTGNKLGLFSYGSGLAASLFSITITENEDELRNILGNLQHIKPLLESREKVAPEKFEACLDHRQKTCHSAPFQPSSSLENLFPGTYYLTKVDEAHRRFYERISNQKNGHS